MRNIKQKTMNEIARKIVEILRQRNGTAALNQIYDSLQAYNSKLARGGVSSTLDSFEVAESSVLRTNFCAENPAHRQSANRYRII